MKKEILIIDNDTRAMKDLKEALNKENYKIINFRKFKKEQAEGFTHIILTGGDHWANLKKFSEEVKLIRGPPAPILGICYGMQLIGKSFGSTLKVLDKINKGNMIVNVSEKNGLFKGIPKKIRVFEYHGYAIKKVGKELKVLANSEWGIESVKHNSLPIWGVQFHPEVIFENEKVGRRIIKNFLRLK